MGIDFIVSKEGMSSLNVGVVGDGACFMVIDIAEYPIEGEPSCTTIFCGVNELINYGYDRARTLAVGETITDKKGTPIVVRVA